MRFAWQVISAMLIDTAIGLPTYFSGFSSIPATGCVYWCFSNYHGLKCGNAASNWYFVNSQLPSASTKDSLFTWPMKERQDQ
jgi:hypothetical protein